MTSSPQIEADRNHDLSGIVETQEWWPSTRWPWLLLLLWIPIAALLGSGISLCLGFIFPLFEESQYEQLVFAGAELIGIFAVVIPIWAEFRTFAGLADWTRITKNIRSTAKLLVLTAASFALYIATVRILSSSHSPPTSFEAVPAVSGPPLFLYWTVSAFKEEFLFRGLVLGFLISRCSSGLAICISSLLFWLPHVLELLINVQFASPLSGVVLGTLHILVLGLWLGWYQLRIGSIYGCVLGHVAANATLWLSWLTWKTWAEVMPLT